MHNYIPPEHVTARAQRRYGTVPFPIDPRRSALVVIDMQNYFVAPGFPAEVAAARDIVPNINAAAAAMRESGGLVAWVQTTAAGALDFWGNHHRFGLSPQSVERRLAGLDESAEGFKLYPQLETMPSDVWVKKIKFSALIPDSSNLHQVLTDHGIETVFIAGTVTNVCCESTARDAMMLDYRVVMLSDANAALSDEEHAGALNTFQIFFGRVMSTQEAVSRWKEDK